MRAWSIVPALRLLTGALSLLSLAACVPTSMVKPVNSASDLASGQTIVVGKLELDPPLAPGEQKLSDSYKEFENVALMILDEQPRVTERLALGDLSRRVDAPFGKNFFVQHPTQSFYILKSWVVMRAKIEMTSPNATPRDTNAPLEGVFRVDVRPGDKAVYIGTIRYHRDEFFSTTKVVVKDDFASAQAEFQRRFGRDVVLRKSLAVPMTLMSR